MFLLLAKVKSTRPWNLLIPNISEQYMEVSYSKIMYNSIKHGCPSLVHMEEFIMNTQKHLTLEDRMTIQLELANAASFKGIGLLLDKDCTTISKEVRLHRVFEKTGAFGKAFNDCVNAFNHSCDLRCVCDRCTTKKRPCWSCGKCAESCISYKNTPAPVYRKHPMFAMLAQIVPSAVFKRLSIRLLMPSVNTKQSVPNLVLDLPSQRRN